MSERISSALCASRHPIQTLEPKPARSSRRLTDYRLDQGFMTRKLDIEIPITCRSHHQSSPAYYASLTSSMLPITTTYTVYIRGLTANPAPSMSALPVGSVDFQLYFHPRHTDPRALCLHLRGVGARCSCHSGHLRCDIE